MGRNNCTTIVTETKLNVLCACTNSLEARVGQLKPGSGYNAYAQGPMPRAQASTPCLKGTLARRTPAS